MKPWGLASTLGENLLLEYAEGMKGKDLGWGRLNSDNLSKILELHAAVVRILPVAPLISPRARGSDLLDSVLRSMEQAETGKAVPGALGPPERHGFDPVGPRYQPLESIGDARPLLGIAGVSHERHAARRRAHLFTCGSSRARHSTSCARSILCRHLSRCETPLHSPWLRPPAKEDVAVTGCESAARSTGCPWETFEKTLQKSHRQPIRLDVNGGTR